MWSKQWDSPKDGILKGEALVRSVIKWTYLNKKRKKSLLLLIRQFRLPTYSFQIYTLNGKNSTQFVDYADECFAWFFLNPIIISVCLINASDRQSYAQYVIVPK